MSLAIRLDQSLTVSADVSVGVHLNIHRLLIEEPTLCEIETRSRLMVLSVIFVNDRALKV